MANFSNTQAKNVVEFLYTHCFYDFDNEDDNKVIGGVIKIHYKGIFTSLNGYLFLKIIEKDGKEIKNTRTRKDVPVTAKFNFKNIEFLNFVNGPDELGLEIAQAVQNAQKTLTPVPNEPVLAE
jgi:hypothetical protein